MKGARPEQGMLTRDSDRTKTEETWRVVEMMVDGLNDHVIDGIGAFFAENFRWMGNAGCGTKNGLRQFQDNWQRPFQAAFSDKVCIDEARLAEGEWMAAFGRQEATHSGEFMGIAPIGKRVEIRSMDFSHVRDGKTVDNWVMVDFPHVMRQLGVDPFDGHGWEQYDAGRKAPPRPEVADQRCGMVSSIDVAAMDVIRHEFGLRIPEDVSIVSYDDVPQAAWPSYALTSICQPTERMVEATVAALLASIEEQDLAPRRSVLPGTLVIRRSAGIPGGWTDAGV